MNYKKMSFISGIVIFTSFIIVLMSIVTLAEKRIFFTRDYVVYVKFSDINGLQDHAKVYMRGYRIGWTKGIQFEDDGVVVKVDINKKFSVPIDSKFELNTVSILGEKAITILPGKSNEYYKQGDTTTGENKDLMVQVKDMVGEVQGYLAQSELNTKLTKVSETLDYLHSTLANVDAQSAKLNMDSYNQQIERVGLAAKRVDDLVNSNQDSIKATIDKTNLALNNIVPMVDDIKQIADKINNNQGSVGELVNNKETIIKLNSTIASLDSLIQDLRQSPGKYVNVSVF